MKWFNCSQMVVLAGFVSVSMLGGGTAKADFTFGEPTLLDGSINSPGIEYFDCISSDGLEIYIEKPVSGQLQSGNWDLYVSTRAATNDPWSVPESLGPTVNGSSSDAFASLSSDDLELYFASGRPGGYGKQDIWVTTRPYRGADWGVPVNLESPINTSDYEMTPWITQDGLELYFSSDRPGGSGHRDIWVSQRASKNDPWQIPVNLGPVVNSIGEDSYPCLAPGGLVLFFSDYDTMPIRPRGYGRSDIYMTRRKSIADPWEEPVNLGPDISTIAYDCQPRLSPDGTVLYFTSSRPDLSMYFQITDIYQAPIIPIVDFNSDGIVDSADMCIMVDYWGTDEPLCDIGPMPWGDGIVDVQDLVVLAEHLFEEVPSVE